MCRYCGKPPPVDSGITSIGGAYWRDDCDNGDGGATTPAEAAYWWDSRADSGAAAPDLAPWRQDAEADATVAGGASWRETAVTGTDAGTALSSSTCFRDTQQQQALEDENFRLKLRVFMLEERLQRMQASAQAHSADPKEAGLRRQLLKKQQLLERASAALEQLEQRNSSQAEAQRQQLALLKHQLEESHQQLQEVNEQLNTTHHQLEDSRHQGNETEEQLSKALDQLMEMHQQLEDTQQSLAGMQQQLAGTQQQLSVTRQKLTEAHQQLDSSRQELAETQRRLQSAERRQSVSSSMMDHKQPPAAASPASSSTLVRSPTLLSNQDNGETAVLRCRGPARAQGRIISQITALKAHEETKTGVKQPNASESQQQCSVEGCPARREVASLRRQLAVAATRRRRQQAAAAAQLQLQTERARSLQASCAQLSEQLLSWRRQLPPPTPSPKPVQPTEAGRQACVASSTEVEVIAEWETPPLVSPELDVTYTCELKTQLAGTETSSLELGAPQPATGRRRSDGSLQLLRESTSDHQLGSEDFPDVLLPARLEEAQRQGVQGWRAYEEKQQELSVRAAQAVESKKGNEGSIYHRRVAPPVVDYTEEDSRSEPDRSVSRARIGLPHDCLEPPLAVFEQRNRQGDGSGCGSAASDSDEEQGACPRCSSAERRLRRRVRVLRQLQQSLSAECAIYRQLVPPGDDAAKISQTGACVPTQVLEEITQLRQKLASFISRHQESDVHHYRSCSPPAEFALALTITQEALTESTQKLADLQQRHQKLKTRLEMTKSLLTDCQKERDGLQQEYSGALHNMRMMQQDVDQLEADNEQLRAANKQLIATKLLSPAPSRERGSSKSKCIQSTLSFKQRLADQKHVSSFSNSSASGEQLDSPSESPKQLQNTEQQLAQLASRRLQLLAKGVRLRSSCRLLRTEQLLLQTDRGSPSPSLSPQQQRSQSIEALANRLRTFSDWAGPQDENEAPDLYANDRKQSAAEESAEAHRFRARQERNLGGPSGERRERRRSSAGTVGTSNHCRERRELGLGRGSRHASRSCRQLEHGRIRHPAGKEQPDDEDPVDELAEEMDQMKLDDISYKVRNHQLAYSAYTLAVPQSPVGADGAVTSPFWYPSNPTGSGSSRLSSTSSAIGATRTNCSSATDHHPSGNGPGNTWMEARRHQVGVQQSPISCLSSFGRPNRLSLR